MSRPCCYSSGLRLRGALGQGVQCLDSPKSQTPKPGAGRQLWQQAVHAASTPLMPTTRHRPFQQEMQDWLFSAFLGQQQLKLRQEGEREKHSEVSSNLLGRSILHDRPWLVIVSENNPKQNDGDRHLISYTDRRGKATMCKEDGFMCQGPLPPVSRRKSDCKAVPMTPWTTAAFP